LQVGGDVYHADHDARRQTDRRDNGALVRRDLIWGGAWIMDAGAFVRGERSLGRARVATTVRLDAVRADADSASTFFVAQNGADLSSTELNWSGATTVRLPLTTRWAVTAGLGSVVRTAEANERFSDRAAAKRAQTNAEFLGNPQLKPERSTQADLWLEGRVSRVQLQVNAFARQLDDYITIEGTNLPRNQAGSPPPVFRFINGQARYYGGEVTASASVVPSLTLTGSVAYLHGQDITLAEPALGVTPLRGDVRARFAPGRAAWFVEGAAHLASEQTRVAVTRGERATSGWSTVDLQTGYSWNTGGSRSVGLRLGARNLLDRAYVQHLTALDAFSAGRIAEPGRVLFARMTVGM
jgi:iron complex outermembrane receptor protein